MLTIAAASPARRHRVLPEPLPARPEISAPSN